MGAGDLTMAETDGVLYLWGSESSGGAAIEQIITPLVYASRSKLCDYCKRVDSFPTGWALKSACLGLNPGRHLLAVRS